MSNAILSSLEEAEPPQDLSAPLQALWWLKKGGLTMGDEWEKGHGIAKPPKVFTIMTGFMRFPIGLREIWAMPIIGIAV